MMDRHPFDGRADLGRFAVEGLPNAEAPAAESPLYPSRARPEVTGADENRGPLLIGSKYLPNGVDQFFAAIADARIARRCPKYAALCGLGRPVKPRTLPSWFELVVSVSVANEVLCNSRQNRDSKPAGRPPLGTGPSGVGPGDFPFGSFMSLGCGLAGGIATAAACPSTKASPMDTVRQGRRGDKGTWSARMWDVAWSTRCKGGAAAVQFAAPQATKALAGNRPGLSRNRQAVLRAPVLQGATKAR